VLFFEVFRLGRGVSGAGLLFLETLAGRLIPDGFTLFLRQEVNVFGDPMPQIP
jgi:hypothetical protein